MLLSMLTFSQRYSGWEASLGLGTIKFQNTESVNVKDNINVGITLEVLKEFENKMYVSSGITFSTLSEAGNLWSNPLKYFSANADVGFRFNSITFRKPYMIPYVSIGTSYINAANTIPDSNASMSLNFTGGVIFWLNDSNWGLTVQNTYKVVESDFMVSHNQFTLGASYKF